MPVPKENRREFNRQAKQRQRDRRRAAGVCTECGKHPPVPGRQSCANCMADQRKWRPG